jgi:hypothetical protein
MNRQILFVIINLAFLSTIFGQNFPGDNPELLLNKTVKPKEIKEELHQYNYENFFLEFNKKKKQFTKNENKNKPFPSSSYSWLSDYNSLLGKEFKVMAIYEIDPNNSISGKEYALEIGNEEIGVIFYKYNPKYMHSFELEVVGGLDYPPGYFCDKIEHRKDKFEDKETLFSPLTNGIALIRTIANGKSYIQLMVIVNGSTLNFDAKGLFILFSDGTKILKPATKVDVEASNGSRYIYSASIGLQQNEIKLLTEKSITDIKVYIYEEAVDKESAFKIKEYLKCISK